MRKEDYTDLIEAVLEGHATPPELVDLNHAWRQNPSCLLSFLSQVRVHTLLCEEGQHALTQKKVEGLTVARRIRRQPWLRLAAGLAIFLAAIGWATTGHFRHSSPATSAVRATKPSFISTRTDTLASSLGEMLATALPNTIAAEEIADTSAPPATTGIATETTVQLDSSDVTTVAAHRLATAAVSAGDGIWTGAAGDGFWETAGNWQSGSVPSNPALAVVFPNPTRVTLSSAVKIQSLSGVDGCTLTVAEGGTLTVANASRFGGTLCLDSGHLTFSGTGSGTLSNLSVAAAALLDVPAAATVTVARASGTAPLTKAGLGKLRLGYATESARCGLPITLAAGTLEYGAVETAEDTTLLTKALEQAWFHVDVSQEDAVIGWQKDATNFIMALNDIRANGVYASAPDQAQPNNTALGKRAPILIEAAQNGLPLADFGTFRSYDADQPENWGGSLQWNKARSNIRGIFLVVGDHIEAEEARFLVQQKTYWPSFIGHTGYGDFHRGLRGKLFHGNAVNDGIRHGPITLDGKPVPFDVVFPAGLHVLALMPTNGVRANTFGRDRLSRYGGICFAEAIVCTNAPTAAEADALTRHLATKWGLPGYVHGSLTLAGGTLAGHPSLMLPATNLAVTGLARLTGGLCLAPATLTLDVANATGSDEPDCSLAGLLTQAAAAVPGTTLRKAGTGTLSLSASNACETLTIEVAGGTLLLATNGSLNAENTVRLAGGALDLGVSTNTARALALTADSELRLSRGQLVFVEGAAADWNTRAELNIAGDLSESSIRFGTNSRALTLAQLASIRLNGRYARLTEAGFLVEQDTRTLYWNDAAAGPWGQDACWSADPHDTAVPDVIQTLFLDHLFFGTASNGLAIGTRKLAGTNVFASLTFGAASGSLTLTNGALELVHAITPVTIANGTNHIASALTGVGGVAFFGARAEPPCVELTGANDFTGDLALSNLTLRLTAGGALGGGFYAGAIKNEGSLVFEQGVTQALAGIQSGSGGITIGAGSVVTAEAERALPPAGPIRVKDGGRLVLNATVVEEQGGGLSAGNDYQVGANSTLDARGVYNLGFNWGQTVHVDGGEVNLYADQYLNHLDLRNGARVHNLGQTVIATYYRSGKYQVGGTSPSFFDGGFALWSGTLVLDVADVTGDASPDFFISGPLVQRSFINYPFPVMTKTGAGTLALATTNDCFASTLSIAEGTVRLETDTALNESVGIILSGGTLDVGATAANVSTLTLTTNSMLRIGARGSIVFEDSRTVAWVPGAQLLIPGTLRPKSIRFGWSRQALTASQLDAIHTSRLRPVALDDAGYLIEISRGTTMIIQGDAGEKKN